MYSSFSNQFYHLAHYGFACFLVFVLAPFLIFRRAYLLRTDQLIANYIRSVFIVITLGYTLVLLKLYEVISLIVVYLIWFVLAHLVSLKKVLGEHSIFRFLFRLFDWLDGLVQLDRTAGQRALEATKLTLWRKWILGWNVEKVLHYILVGLVFGYAAFIRFKDALTHAAPPMSDSYVTLAWLKYINEHQLFQDGIYPQGFHIVLSTLSKFSSIDPLYVLKYTGPMVSLMIVFGLYFFVKRTTGSFAAGLLAGALYGLGAAHLLLGDLERQIATNSQEFSFSFIFISLYFLVNYVVYKRKEDLWVGLAGTAIIGLVHSLGFAYMGLSIALLILANLFIQKKEAWKTSVQLAVCSVGTVGLSLLPLLIGLIMHKEVHSSSENYLTSVSQTEIPFPSLKGLDKVTILMLPILFLDVLLGKRTVVTRITTLFTAILGTVIFLIYYAMGRLTGSVLISSRSLDLWALTVPLVLGISCFMLSQWGKVAISRILKHRLDFRDARGAQIGTIFLILFVIVGFHPGPINAYKMERDNSIEQYLKIKNHNTTHNWMIVSNNEGYAVVLGNGVHMYLSTFVKRYDSNKPALTKVGTNGLDRNVPSEVYVFNEKKVYEVPKTLGIYSLLKPEYENRKKTNQQFEEWVKRYKAHSNKVDIFYQSKTLTVYHFHIPEKKKKPIVPFWENK